jgi:hypothetical protein
MRKGAGIGKLPPAPGGDDAAKRQATVLMQSTSLISAFMSAQVGQVQLAAAGYLAQNDPESESSVSRLMDAAQQSSDSLANVAAGIGTKISVIA